MNRQIRLRSALTAFLTFLCALTPVAPLRAARQDPLPTAIENARKTRDESQLLAVSAELERRIAENPRDAQHEYLFARVQAYLVDVYEKRKDKKAAEAAIDKAIKAAQRSLELDEKSSDAHSLLADLYGRKISYAGFLSGRKYGPLCKQENKRALELDTQNPRAWASLGRQYFMAPKMFGGDVGKAVESFQKSLQLDPQQDETWVWLAIACKKHGDRGLARDAVAKALQLNPQSAFARDVSASLEK